MKKLLVALTLSLLVACGTTTNVEDTIDPVDAVDLVDEAEVVAEPDAAEVTEGDLLADATDDAYLPSTEPVVANFDLTCPDRVPLLFVYSQLTCDGEAEYPDDALTSLDTIARNVKIDLEKEGVVCPGNVEERLEYIMEDVLCLGYGFEYESGADQELIAATVALYTEEYFLPCQ